MHFDRCLPARSPDSVPPRNSPETMKSHPTLEDLTRTHWVMLAILGTVTAALLLVAQMLDEIPTAHETWSASVGR